MNRPWMRWICSATVVAVLIILVGLSAKAGPAAALPSGGDVNRAKEMGALIEQGQLSLRYAAELAEQHCKGPALEARCEIQPGPIESPDRAGNPPAGAGQPGEKEPIAGKRLVYEISCFAKEKAQTVRVDGLTKKVTDVPDAKDNGPPKP